MEAIQTTLDCQVALWPLPTSSRNTWRCSARCAIYKPPSLPLLQTKLAFT